MGMGWTFISLYPIPQNRNLLFAGGSLSFSGFSQDTVMTQIEFFTQLPLAQAAPPAGGGFAQFLPIILLFVGMWFLIIAPQRKRQKAHDKMLSELKTGDEIVTSGGLYGTITNVKDDRLVVRIADNTKVELGKSFVASKLGAEVVK